MEKLFNFQGLAQIGWFTVVTLVITFCIIDMFDTIRTLVGTASRANMLDEKGNMPKMKEALLADAATSSALIYVGLLMLGGLKKIDFEDISHGLPAALMLICMPISGSIGHGIGLGMISYTMIKVFTGKAKEVSILTYIIALLFLVKFFLAV